MAEKNPRTSKATMKAASKTAGLVAGGVIAERAAYQHGV
jgi:hypothetical protein